jgi:hypothetical protein
VADERGTSEPAVIRMVVPVRNGMPWIEHQPRAPSTQRSPGEWDVMVAGTGSQDGTRSYVQRWSERDPRIHLVRASARRAAAGGTEHRVPSARGGRLAFCDAEDVVRRAG